MYEPAGQVMAIQTPQTGAQHYSYSSASAHPSGVNLAYTRSNIWVHDNINNGALSFPSYYPVKTAGAGHRSQRHGSGSST